MATMTSPANERRHIPDRRMSAGASAMHMPSGTASSMSGATEARSASTSGNRSMHMEKSGARSRMNVLDWIAMALLIVGGLNWGLVGLFEMDLVARLFGDMTPISRVIYVLVGLSALYSIYTSSKMGRTHE